MDKIRIKSQKYLTRHSASKFEHANKSKPELLIRLRKSQLHSDQDDYDDEMESEGD